MNTIITKDSNQQYNTMVLNYNKEKKALADDMLYTIAALPIDEALSTRNVVDENMFQVVMMTQTMHLVMQNWNKSFNNSTYTYPTIEQYQNKTSTIKTTRETEENRRPYINTNSNKIFSNDDDPIPSLNNALRKKYATTSEIKKGVDAFVESFERYYEEQEIKGPMSEEIMRLIVLLTKVVMYIKMQYDLCRNDDSNFSTLVMLQSYTKPILNGVPKFPTLSRLNSYDYVGWCNRFGFTHSPIEEQKMLTKYNIIDGSWVLRKWTTNKFWNNDGYGPPNKLYTYGEYVGNGFYYLTGETTTGADGSTLHRVRGYYYGLFARLGSNCQMQFEGWTLPENLGTFDKTFLMQMTTVRKVFTRFYHITYRI